MAKQQTSVLVRLVSETIPKGSCKASIRRAALGYARLFARAESAATLLQQLTYVRVGLEEEYGSDASFAAQALLLAEKVS